MPNYSESESQGLREKFEAIVLQWPDVEKKMLFGSPWYTTRGTSFAMLVTGGFILTHSTRTGRPPSSPGPRPTTSSATAAS